VPRCRAHDLFSFAPSRREVTRENYLVAPAVLGRCGIQTYLRGELGLDGDPNAPVRLMRLPEEVFRPETLASFENKPLTYRHPEAGVDSASWRELAKGNVRDVAKLPGDLMGGTLWVMDAEQVTRVVGGDVDLSCGYSFDLDMTPGTAPDGQAFDGYQRKILGDHLAILDRAVDSPRGGPICRISDKHQEKTMGNRKIAVDGLPRFELDELAADAIESRFKVAFGERDQVVADLAAHRTASKKAFDAKNTQIKDLTTKVTAKDTEISELKAKLDRAKAIDIDALVIERTKVLTDAKVLAPDADFKGSAMEIRKIAIGVACSDATNKAVADAVFGEGGIEKATDSQIKAAFGALIALPKQAAILAQDEAVNRALGATSTTSVGDGEVFRGEADYESNVAKAGRAEADA
jgi:hypothetical protein